MAQPTRSDWKIDIPLTNTSVAFVQDQTKYIADKVFPIVPVGKKSDKYYIYPRNAWLRDGAKVRAPLTETAGGGYELSNDSYDCAKFGIHKDIDNDDLYEERGTALDFEMDATEWVTQQLLIRREIQFATNYLASGVWTDDVTPGVLWDTYATSDPIDDIETGIQTILERTGFKPNSLVLGYETFRFLKHHPDFLDRYRYTSSQSLTTAMIGAVLGIPNVQVAEAIVATNAEGAAESYAFVHGKSALLCYSNPNPRPTLRQASAGYVFAYDRINQGPKALAPRIRKFELPKEDGLRVEGEFAFDMKKVSADLGYFFDGAVS